jgi:hypothetical protein
VLLLLFGIVGAVWVPRVGEDTTDNGEAEEVAAAYPVFTGMRNGLSFARDCYQLARDPEDPKTPAEDREALALNKFLAVGPHFVTLANAPTSQWHSLDAWYFLRGLAKLLRSSRDTPTWVTAWGRICRELRQQETMPDFDRFFLEIDENLRRLLPSAGAPAPFYLPLQTVSSVNVDPQYALEQFWAKTTEQDEPGIVGQGAPEAIAGGTAEGFEPSELNEREQDILKALLLLRATGKKRGVSRDQAAKKADSASPPSSYYRAVAELRKRGLIATSRGPNAGIWLLPKGMSAAEALESKPPPQKVE